MPGNDDETRTRVPTGDPALDATTPAPPAASAARDLGRGATVPVSSDPGSDATLPASSGPSGGPGRRHLGHEADGVLPPGTRIGRYVVEAELGTGGMGVVYRARDPELARDVAIKVVRPSAASRRAQERLLEEARAMARLRHPSVVPVFDVGSTAHGVFIAMPLVRGGTLHDWMREPRPWREVLARFLAAGRGLAAAHAAGLIHRDFKPRNVLVGERGQVLVADFGIAARTDDTPGSLDPDAPRSSPGSARVSSIAGTPAYMAPEQAAGDVIDARADQYSFCVSLWEALCGIRPSLPEDGADGGLLSTRRRHRRLIAPGRGAPAWLLAAVARGFEPAPDDRWPSMAAFLAHVERRRRRPQLIAAAAAGVGVLGVVLAAALVVPGGDDDPCPAPRARLAAAWSPAVRAQVERAFTASGLPFASDALARVLPALDAYADDWSQGHVAACRAARVERTQSPALLERRMACLDRRLAALRARAQAFAGADADPAVVAAAVAVVEELPPLAACADTEALLTVTATVPAPARAEADALERALDDAAALEVRGEPTARVAAVTPLVGRARAMAHPPLVARALLLLARAHRAGGLDAEPALRELVQVAAEARDDATGVEGWLLLVDELATRRGKLNEARALEPVAEAALVRAGSPPALAWRLAAVLAARAHASGDGTRAVDRARAALAAAPTPLARARAGRDLARLLAAHGQVADAVRVADAALADAEQALGPHHPDLAAHRAQLDELRAAAAPGPEPAP